MFSRIFRKIKDFFVFYCCRTYLSEHYLKIDENIDFLMNHATAVYTDISNFWIIIETDNDLAYALWNANYPYNWIAELKIINEKNTDNRHYHVHSKNSKKIYEYKLPTIRKMIQFKNWMLKNYPYWEPYKEDRMAKIREELG